MALSMHIPTDRKEVNIMSKQQKANNQRSNIKNPTSPDFKANLDNRSGQLDSQNPKYYLSRGIKPAKGGKK